MIDKNTAIRNTHPVVVTIRGEEAFDGNNQSIALDETLIQAEVTRLQDIYDSQAYARARKIKYDALNQDELRFDDLMNGTTTWQDAILAIKAEIPKPQENN